MNLKEFYRIMEHIPIGVFILDSKGNYLYVNQQYCNTVNKTKSFFKDMSAFKLKEMGYLVTSAWEQVMERKQKVVAIISIVDKNLNRVYDTLTTGVPVFDKTGSIEYVIFRQETLASLYKYTQKGALNKLMYRDAEVSVVPSDDVVAESGEMQRLLAMVDVVAKTDASILVTGPSGSGKEIIAKRIHQQSTYSNGPLVILNCAALPESLMESELFGYEPGAFTGALGKGKKGMFEMANGGTLFLDEINSIPMGIQSKLLRVLETKKVTRIGSVEDKDIQFQLVCASNENLHSLISAHRFRADLYYRINVISMYVPPLCQRKEDITPLALHFMKYFCRKYNSIKVLSPSLLEFMNEYHWPGNVRELRNFVERLVVMSPQSELEITDVPSGSFNGDSDGGVEPHITPQTVCAADFSDEDFSFRRYMEQCEKDILRQALEQFQSPSAAAKALKIDLSNVYRKMQKYNM